MITILLVDDEPELLNVTKIYLERAGGISVQIFSCAETALVACSSRRYDVIISDYEMPGLNGITFLKRLRSAGDQTPFILFTGRGREVVAIEAMKEGASFYLQKGGDPKAQFAELVTMIRQSMQRTITTEEIMQTP